MYTYINSQMSEYSIGPFPTHPRVRVGFEFPPARTRRRPTMGVYDDEDAVRADVDMEEEEEEIGQVRATTRFNGRTTL